jgi:hypothetical protein
MHWLSVCPCADETQVCLSMSIRAAGPIGLSIKKEKLANHVTSGGVTFEVSSRKIFYCTCVAHYQRNFPELRRCSCIVDMRHDCILCGLLHRRYKIIIHRTALFSFICCFAPPLNLKFIFSRVYLGIIVDASPLWLLTDAIFGDFAVSHLYFVDFLDNATYFKCLSLHVTDLQR